MVVPFSMFPNINPSYEPTSNCIIKVYPDVEGQLSVLKIQFPFA